MDSNNSMNLAVLRPWWPWLGSAAFLLGLSFALAAYWQASSSERLFQAHFKAIPGLAADQNARVFDQATPTTRAQAIHQQALQYQEAGQYRLALIAWRSYFSDEESEEIPYTFLYAALAAHAEGALDEAAYFLEQLPPASATPFGEELQWYRALTALRQQDKERAITLLQQLADQPLTHYGAERAPLLLAALAAPPVVGK